MLNGDSPSNLYSDTKLSNYLVALRTSGGQASCHVASLITLKKFQDALERAHQKQLTAESVLDDRCIIEDN